MRKQRLTLEIVWDEQPEGEGPVPEPASWGWHDLLDLGGDEQVTVVHAGPSMIAKPKTAS